MVRTRLGSFALFDTIGALLWSGVAVALGWVFRDAVNEILAVFSEAGRWGLIALIVALALFIAVKALQRYQLIRSLRMSRVSVDELNDLLGRQRAAAGRRRALPVEPAAAAASPAPSGSTATRSTKACVPAG